MHQAQWSPERPLPPPVSLASPSHHEKPPEVTCTSRGNPGFPASTRESPRETFFNTTEAVRRFLDYLFREKGFRTVYASFFTGNDASRRVMEKCGMRFHHVSPKELEYLGKERDLTYYSITKETALRFCTLRDCPERTKQAARWFHSKWRAPEEAYLACMRAYLDRETEYGWYLCLDGERIVGGLGVIENDFHDRKDLTPNVCAVYTENEYRRRGIAGRMLNMAVEDLRAKGVSPVYLLTDHTGFYERYGWEFLCMAQGEGETKMSRMYIHR